MIKNIITSILLSTYPANVFNYELPGLPWGTEIEKISSWAEDKYFIKTDRLAYSDGNFAGVRVSSMRVGYCPSSGLHTVEFHYAVSRFNYKYTYRDLVNFLKAKYGQGFQIAKFPPIKGKDDYDLIKMGKGKLSHFWKEEDSNIILTVDKDDTIKLSFQSLKHADKCYKRDSI